MAHRFPLSAAAALVVAASSLSAQTSPYVVMAGDQSTFHVLQNGAIVRSFGLAPGTAQYQYPLVVTSTIRTMGANAGDDGAEYDLNGNDLGARYTHPVGPSRGWDGTTDGGSHYTIDTGGGVWRLDRDWANPTMLFDAGGLGSLTYDPTSDTLWVSQFSTSTITEYTLAGGVASSFTTGHTQNMALALDHADGTLWLHDRTTRGTFEQWSKSGNLLARIAVPGMASENALGGECPFPRSASCTFRNGNGVNPADFDCVTPPALGSDWVTSYNDNPTTSATFLAVGVGPAIGPAFANGEWLITLAPLPATAAGTGDIRVAIPASATLLGVTASAQGVRVDTVGPARQLVLLNAQDLVIGY